MHDAAEHGCVRKTLLWAASFERMQHGNVVLIGPVAVRDRVRAAVVLVGDDVPERMSVDSETMYPKVGGAIKGK